MYIDYLKARVGYDNALGHLHNLLDRQEELFMQTLPTGIRYDLDKVKHSITTGSAFDEYLANVEVVEEKIRAARLLVYERGEVLALLEKDLRASKNLKDRIFVKRWLDNKKVVRIAMELNYSQERIYQLWKGIKEDITKYYN